MAVALASLLRHSNHIVSKKGVIHIQHPYLNKIAIPTSKGCIQNPGLLAHDKEFEIFRMTETEQDLDL